VERAKEVLDSIRSTDDEVLDEMQVIITSTRKNYRNEAKADSTLDQIISMLSNPATRRALFLGCGMMVLQQGIGINTVMYYSATIYQMSGYSESQSIWLAALSSLSQIVGVVLSVIFVDKLGRRVLVLGSLVLISFCMLGLGASFYLARIGSSPVDLTSPLLDPDCASQPALLWNGITSYCYDCIQIDGCGFCQGACVQGDVFGPTEDTCPDNSYAKAACTNPYGWMPIVFMIGFLISYGVGMAGLPWTINSEIYPSSCKSRAISLSTGTMWLSNLVISTSFLTISSPGILTTYGAFWMYATIALGGAGWLFVALPETKGLSFKEIERQFERPDDKIHDEEVISLHVSHSKTTYGSDVL
jgi:SP family myo-inositol transporter-like MFS transporter 13